MGRAELCITLPLSTSTTSGRARRPDSRYCNASMHGQILFAMQAVGFRVRA